MTEQELAAIEAEFASVNRWTATVADALIAEVRRLQALVADHEELHRHIKKQADAEFRDRFLRGNKV